MFTFVLTLHFILCGSLVCLVLMQQGKGADMGAAFGAGSSNSLFGAGGANNLVVKITTFVAIAFMVTSIVLINLTNSADSAIASASSSNSQDLSGSVMEQVSDSGKAADSAVPQESATQAADQPTISLEPTKSDTNPASEVKQ